MLLVSPVKEEYIQQVIKRKYGNSKNMQMSSMHGKEEKGKKEYQESVPETNQHLAQKRERRKM